MQRIVCRYCRDCSTSALSHPDLRVLFEQAAELAGIPLSEERRTIMMGPPLPSGATSEAERLVIELREPREPSQVRLQINTHLPAGLCIEQAWIAQPGGPEENPTHLDEAVYEVLWQGAPATDELSARLQEFLMASVVQFTRIREKKTQQLNARALLREVRLLASEDGRARLLMTVSIGPKGSLRPDELLAVLGYAPLQDDLHVHRIALHQSAWHHRSPRQRGVRWEYPDSAPVRLAYADLPLPQSGEAAASGVRDVTELTGFT